MRRESGIGGDYPASGKTAADENFPVASLLIAARHRTHIKVLYRFARTLDDVADSPLLHPAEKVTALRSCAQSLTEPAHGTTIPAAVRAMRESLEETRLTPRHCQDLVRAFTLDANKKRYASWNELMDYCMLSAAPIGRHLLDLHGESAETYPASDALCNALQVLNHLQDCGADYGSLDRVYLPQDWMQSEAVPCTALGGTRVTPALRRVLDRCLSGTQLLLTQAAPLPMQLKSLRLAMEVSIILAIAHRLAEELKCRDPLAEPIRLRSSQYGGCMLRGIASAWLRRATVRPQRCGQTTTPPPTQSSH